MNNTYNKGEIQFKNLSINWNLYTIKTTKEEINEVFKIIITDDEKTSIEYDFNNSIMEYKISEGLLNYREYMSIKTLLNNTCRYWGGYDDINTLKKLNIERQKNLIYSVINCLFNDINFTNMSFYDFCGNFGYNYDSRKDLNLYEKCFRLGLKINKLNINFDYEYIQQEKESFIKEINKIFQVV